MKKGILALVLVLLVSLFTQPCFAAEVNDLVTFDGYDARMYDYNGVRVIYTLDTSVLDELEKDYNVSVGVLLAADVAESAYETEMVIGKAKVDNVFYSTEKGYVGKYYDKADGNKEFVYAVTFESDADKKEANLSKAIASRVYVKLVSKTSGTDTVYYVDSNSAEFGKALSMKELAENFVVTTNKNYPILQRLLNSSLKEMFINNVSIDKFSVTGTNGESVSAAIEEKLGYKLPIVETPYFADSYISAGEDASLAQDVLYKITANGAVINIGYNSASKDSAISKFKEILNVNGTLIDETIEETNGVKYKVTYDEGKYIEVEEGETFSIPVVYKADYTFLGYFTEDDVQVADLEGNSLADFVLTDDITVIAKYKRIPTDADTANGQLLGNPLKAYYKSTTSFAHKMSRNPHDLIVYDGKVYIGGGTYDGGWVSAPPMSVYDIASGTWGNVDFTVKMYEALDADSTTKKWYELPATKSNSNNVSNQNVGIIPVTTDCEISNFRFIGGKPIALGADTINGNTWADGTVSTSTTTTQKYAANNLGNYYIVEEDENGNERWVEYRNNVLHGTHVYDVVEIDYNGEKTLMFAVGGSSNSQLPAKILANKNTKSYVSPKFYLKDGSTYTVTETNRYHRIYNFFKTDEGIFAFYALQGGTTKKIFKYNFTNNEHRFDEVRDIEISASSSDTKNYVQKDVNSSGVAISSKRLWTDFMRTETYNGYAYYTTGYLYKTKTFEKSATTAITAPNSAIITDLAVREGKLYALGFVNTDSTTNAYTNYIWSIDENDNFTQIRVFNTVGAYALSFDKDEDFFYVGLGGPTTHITTSVANVGNILKLSINPITE